MQSPPASRVLIVPHPQHLGELLLAPDAHTLEIVCEVYAADGEEPCTGGREFAEAHPHPFECLEAALADTPHPGGAWGFVIYTHARLFGCEACDKLAPSELWAYGQRPPPLYYRTHAGRCAADLRAWLRTWHKDAAEVAA